VSFKSCTLPHIPSIVYFDNSFGDGICVDKEAIFCIVRREDKSSELVVFDKEGFKDSSISEIVDVDFIFYSDY
jgi:hypothetical protein